MNETEQCSEMNQLKRKFEKYVFQTGEQIDKSIKGVEKINWS